MAWEKRGRNGQLWYYYRSKRIAGVVRKEYLGRGAAAEAAAVEDLANRAARIARQIEKCQTALAQEVSCSLISELDFQVESLLRAALVRAGYRRHKRSEWRRRRCVVEKDDATS